MTTAITQAKSSENNLKELIGCIPNTGDSVKEVREIRRLLSKQVKAPKYLEKINKLAD